MIWIRRIRWRWVVLGGFVWLTLLSSASLEDGHAGLARFCSTAVMVLLASALLIAILRLIGRLVIAVVRQGVQLWRRQHHSAPRSQITRSPSGHRAR